MSDVNDMMAGLARAMKEGKLDKMMGEVMANSQSAEEAPKAEQLPLSDTGRGPFFDREQTTVMVPRVPVSVDEKLRKFVWAKMSDYSWRVLQENCQVITEVLRVIQLYLDHLNGWFPLDGGLWYQSRIDAVVPMSARGPFPSWPQRKKDISEPFGPEGRYVGTPPKQQELEALMLRGGPDFSSSLTWFCWGSQERDTVDFGRRFNPLPDVEPSQGAFASRLLEGMRMDKVAGQAYGNAYCPRTRQYDTPPFSVYYLPVFRFHQQCLTEPLTAQQVLSVWCLYGLEPDIFDFQEFERQRKELEHEDTSDVSLALYRLKAAWRQGFQQVVSWFRSQPEVFDPQSETLLSAPQCGKLLKAGKAVLGLQWDDMCAKVLSGKADYANEYLEQHVRQRLLTCDLNRSNLTPAYDEKCLVTLGEGHWDLWANNSRYEGQQELLVPCRFYARNPLKDIHEGAVVGIDFGTKSTVVVRLQNGEDIEPLRIGWGKLDEMPEGSEDYENPTIIQFLDWKHFQEAYRQREGRPDTSWDDLTVSHAASQERQNCMNGVDFKAFFPDLKQWAGAHEGQEKVFLDRKGAKEQDRDPSQRGKFDFQLAPFMELTEDEVNPLEVYAYHIGLQVNNMHRGIHLRYELSYPVTYRKENLEKLRLSFERGIRKSLPLSVLEDQEAMSKFSVRFGASEPAAFALCALQSEYGLEPEEDSPIYFGVFDFGGGTTDFDFGIYSLAPDESGKDYVLTHFGADGDQYLGGENMLQLMAYKVFRDNAQELQRKHIRFCRPYECENTNFPGAEVLVSDTAAEAQVNMQKLMDELRCLWEGRGQGHIGKDQTLKLNLESRAKDEHDSTTSEITLTVKVDELRKLIHDRIERGIDRFFSCVRQSFIEPNVTEKVDKIYILPAGNSCKSPVVAELFEEKIAAFQDGGNELLTDVSFVLLPLLNTPEAEEWIQKHPAETSESARDTACAWRPTGKTGVAFGLVMGRDGGDVLVVDRNRDEAQEIGFQFSVGFSRRKILNVVLDWRTEKESWQEVKTVGVDSTFELYYTNKPEARDGKMLARQAWRLPLPVSQPAQQGMMLFVRWTGPNSVDYAIAPDEADIDEASVKTLHLEC